MRLVELFNQVRDVEWEDQGNFHQARFKAEDGQEYRITFYEEPLKTLKYTARNLPDVIETLSQINDDAKITRVEFSLQEPTGGGYYNTKYGKTGTGNQYAVFATVIEAIKTFTQEHGFDHVRIVAEEPNRQRLYKRMIKAMPHKNVFTNKDPVDGQEAYIIEL